MAICQGKVVAGGEEKAQLDKDKDADEDEVGREDADEKGKHENRPH